MNAQDKTVDAAASTPSTAAPCCGTSEHAETEGACCGTSAKTEAVAAGATCCG
jgi:hypothetical protein